MPGYVGQSKSVSAVNAEADCKFPATEAARRLGVSVAAVKAILVPCEWHHTSKYYNQTDYYDVTDLSEDELAALRAYRPAHPQGRTYLADVRWLEWSGSRNHCKATERTAQAVDVTERGAFYTFALPGGECVRKKIGSNGTVVIPRA
jgi:hypothetical protein